MAVGYGTLRLGGTTLLSSAPVFVPASAPVFVPDALPVRPIAAFNTSADWDACVFCDVGSPWFSSVFNRHGT